MRIGVPRPDFFIAADTAVHTPTAAVTFFALALPAGDTIRGTLAGALPHADSSISFASIQVRFIRRD